MNKILWFILSVGEFWVAMWLSMLAQPYAPQMPLTLLVPAFWLAIHFGIPKLLGREPLW